MTTQPDDRATELAKAVLAEIKRVNTMSACLGKDATEAQELVITLAIRQYFIEETEKLQREILAKLEETARMTP